MTTAGHIAINTSYAIMQLPNGPANQEKKLSTVGLWTTDEQTVLWKPLSLLVRTLFICYGGVDSAC